MPCKSHPQKGRLRGRVFRTQKDHIGGLIPDLPHNGAEKGVFLPRCGGMNVLGADPHTSDLRRHAAAAGEGQPPVRQ